MQPRYKEADKIIKTGKNRLRQVERIHYDLDSENVTVYYDQGNFQLSFKPGPLRAVQYRLAFVISRLCHAEGKDLEFIMSYPYNTIDRLEFLHDSNVFSANRDVLNDVAEMYAFFLRMYHKSEVTWELDYGLKATTYDAQKSKEIKEALRELLKALKDLFGF